MVEQNGNAESVNKINEKGQKEKVKGIKAKKNMK